MRFEILDSSGLSTTDLSGIIGQSILPHDYTITELGNLQIGNRIISNSDLAWDKGEMCQKLTSTSAVEQFLGHKVSDYHVTNKFDIFNPKWQTANLVENASPK